MLGRVLDFLNDAIEYELWWGGALLVLNVAFWVAATRDISVVPYAIMMVTIPCILLNLFVSCWNLSR